MKSGAKSAPANTTSPYVPKVTMKSKVPPQTTVISACDLPSNNQAVARNSGTIDIAIIPRKNPSSRKASITALLVANSVERPFSSSKYVVISASVARKGPNNIQIANKNVCITTNKVNQILGWKIVMEKMKLVFEHEMEEEREEMEAFRAQMKEFDDACEAGNETACEELSAMMEEIEEDFEEDFEEDREDREDKEDCEEHEEESEDESEEDESDDESDEDLE